MKQVYILTAILFLSTSKMDAQVTLTQTTTNNITLGTSIACRENTFVTRDNIYYRAFNLNSLGYSSFSITNVEFGIEEVADESAGFAVEAVIYGTDNFPAGTLTELAAVSIPLVSSDSNTMKSVPIAYDVITSSYPILVFGIRVPDEFNNGNITQFFIGANSDGQTEECYFSADACGFLEPVTLTSIGFPDAHYVMNIIGNATLGNEEVSLDSKKITIFPNPTSDFIRISGLKKVENYRIYNILGSEIKKGSISDDEKIDIQNIANGLYLLKFDNGNTIRFIKE